MPGSVGGRSSEEQIRYDEDIASLYNVQMSASAGASQLNAGRCSPLGATVDPTGVNFSIYSRDATKIELLLYDNEDDLRPSDIVTLEAATNHTYHYWHTFVAGLRAGQIYAYRVHGPFQPNNGIRLDPAKVLLDPYGRGVAVPKNYFRGALSYGSDNSSAAMKSVIVDPRLYDWEGDAPLHRPSSQSIIYEMHVKGFTQNPNSGVPADIRGTYRGLIEKIEYLRELGITAIELLPVFQFDPQDCPRGLVNYWGYAPVSFFAPHHAYSSRQGRGEPVNEFRDMVKALHRAGIAVILDVVFNHTAEGNENGPTFCFRGIDNRAYYILEQDRSHYANYSGTGNTLNANHPIVRRMIMDSLRYWVEEMHVDGFRFDLASILSRDSSGAVLSNPPVLWDIESDPVLAGTKMIAEAWDAGSLYQVGSFIGDSWKEWNGQFRDDVRSFLRGENSSVRHFADRLLGSKEIYEHEEREAEQSVNFVTCHDGFTLSDLVSYDHKHNELNAEQNRDGSNDNRSWNCGAEGPTDDPAVESLRNRQVKNFLTATMISLGLPMFVMGDEMRRTQCGNNNAYCLDDECTWLDWSLLEKHADVHRFVKLLTARRTLRYGGPERERMPLTQLISTGFKDWHGIRLHKPDWSDCSHSIALSIQALKEPISVYVIFNAYSEALDFQLPHGNNGEQIGWRRWIDTSQQSPADIVPWETALPVSGCTYHAESRSAIVLWATHCS